MRDAAIRLRALPGQRDLIDQAASALGRKRSDLVLEAASEAIAGGSGATQGSDPSSNRGVPHIWVNDRSGSSQGRLRLECRRGIGGAEHWPGAGDQGRAVRDQALSAPQPPGKASVAMDSIRTASKARLDGSPRQPKATAQCDSPSRQPTARAHRGGPPRQPTAAVHRDSREQVHDLRIPRTSRFTKPRRPSSVHEQSAAVQTARVGCRDLSGADLLKAKKWEMLL